MTNFKLDFETVSNRIEAPVLTSLNVTQFFVSLGNYSILGCSKSHSNESQINLTSSPNKNDTQMVNNFLFRFINIFFGFYLGNAKST